MILPIGIALAVVAGVCAGAEAYRWVDERGVVTYGEKPPANVPARLVDIQPRGAVIEPGGVERRKPGAPQLPVAEERPAPPPPPSPTAAPVRGMDFDTFIRLQRGMTEGELLLRAGRPDHESIESIRHEIVKTYYYFPTPADPYTTVVTLRGGRIASVDRIRKF